MKKNLFAFAVVALMMASFAVVKAAEPGILNVDIPFQFAVGNEYLPAGHYTVQLTRIGEASQTGTCLIVTSRDGKLIKRVVSSPRANSRTAFANIVFRKYQDKYFLANVESYGVTCELRKSEAEKRMAATRPAQELAAVRVSE